jgi:hypothetical protein
MAAILCKTIGELLSKTCQCIKLPCSYLGQACGKSCDMLGEVMCTPFAPYLIVTLGLNTPAVVYALKSIENYDCSYSLFRWLVINAAFGLCHMVAAFYITGIIRAPAPRPDEGIIHTVTATTGLNSPKAAEEGRYVEASNFRPITDGDNSVPGGPNSFKRVKHVLCYDKGMAIYIMIFLSWIVWMGIGVGRRLSNGGDGNCDDMLGYMNTAIVSGYIWMSMVGMAFCCSLMCLR